MHSYTFLLQLALILLSTKVLGLLTKKFNMPQVVGALFAGLILGPAVLNIMGETEFLSQLSELGVIVLMFTAGMEADVTELKKTGKASLVIAAFGVIVPLVGGFGVAYFFNRSSTDTNAMLQNIFLGIILTATSVSITVETLKELGKLNSKAGNAILGAAIIDDILGIVALTVITSMADTSVKIGIVLLKVMMFFVVAALVGYLFYRFYKRWAEKCEKDMRRFVIVAFVFCLLMSYGAEVLFGVADITGAFIAGLIISNTEKTKYVANRFEILSYTLISPVFFASIGLRVVIPQMNASIIVFTVLLVVVAVLTKILGCGLGAKISGFTTKQSLQVGTGMVSRGEVALIVAMKGAAVGLVSAQFLGPIVLVVVATTILTPILLKIVFKSKKGTNKTLDVSVDEKLLGHVG